VTFAYYTTAESLIEEPAVQMPLYNIVDCQETRYFFCQYNLSESTDYDRKSPKARQTSQGSPPNDLSHLYSPSHVRSCEDIVILKELAIEINEYIRSSNSSHWTQADLPLLEQFLRSTKGYFIFAVKPPEGSKETVSFQLKYCDLPAAKSRLMWDSSERSYHVYLFMAMFQ